MDETGTTEEAAWAEVEARWLEAEAHRAYLARSPGLEGLAEAGRRYKAALDAKPGDAVALRWRDEVLKRATALALAQLPRTRPPREAPSRLGRTLLALALVVTLSALGWMLMRLPVLGARR